MPATYGVADRDVGAGVPTRRNLQQGLYLGLFQAQQGSEYAAQIFVAAGQQQVLYRGVHRAAADHARALQICIRDAHRVGIEAEHGDHGHLVQMPRQVGSRCERPGSLLTFGFGPVSHSRLVALYVPVPKGLVEILQCLFFLSVAHGDDMPALVVTAGWGPGGGGEYPPQHVIGYRIGSQTPHGAQRRHRIVKFHQALRGRNLVASWYHSSGNSIDTTSSACCSTKSSVRGDCRNSRRHSCSAVNTKAPAPISR